MLQIFCKLGIPYRIIGGARLLDRQEAKDLVSYLRVVLNPNDDAAFSRVINVPKVCYIRFSCHSMWGKSW